MSTTSSSTTRDWVKLVRVYQALWTHEQRVREWVNAEECDMHLDEELAATRRMADQTWVKVQQCVPADQLAVIMDGLFDRFHVGNGDAP